MTEFEKELVRFVSGYLDAGVSAEDYVKAFSQRLLNSIGRQSKPKVSEELETEALRSAGVLLSEHFEDEDDDAIRTTALRCWKGGVIHGASWQKEQMMKKADKPCHTVEEWMEKIKNADALTKTIFSKGPYDVLYDALNHPYRDCYDAVKEFGELCYQTARQEMMRSAVEGEAHPDDCEIWVNLVGYGYKFNDGDKVRIIVVKED